MIFKNLLLKLSQDKIYFFVLITALLLAIFFRINDYKDRVYFQADNSRDVQVAQYAADNFKLPKIGQFSSAGPFFYGPWYYWFLELISFLPFGLLTQWYVITFFSIVFLVLIFYIGLELGGKGVALISFIFASFSTSLINTSFFTWNPTIIPILVLVSLIFFLRFYENYKKLDLFFVAFFVSLAISVHFQSILILPMILLAIILICVKRMNIFINLSVLIIGSLVPMVPLIYFDSKFYWHNFTSIVVFFAVDQYAIWVPNRWLTYLKDYWPNTWSSIIGGSKLIGYLLITFTTFTFLLKLKEIDKHKKFYLFFLLFAFEIILLRYYRGERFAYYSMFSYPLVIIISAYVVNTLIKFNKFLGGIFLAIILTFTSVQNIKDFRPRGVTIAELEYLKNNIYSSIGNNQINVFGCSENASSISHPLALMAYHDKRNSLDGIKIGVCEEGDKLNWELLSQEEVNSPKFLWINKTTETVYFDTVEWWVKNPPQKGGSLWKFLKSNYRK